MDQRQRIPNLVHRRSSSIAAPAGTAQTGTTPGLDSAPGPSRRADATGSGRLLSRFSIALLAGVLVGAGFGQFLDSHLAIMSRFAGLTGLVCYGALELVAHYRYWERQAGIQESAELRLARRLRREQRRHDDARRGRSRVRPPQAAGPTTPRRSR